MNYSCRVGAPIKHIVGKSEAEKDNGIFHHTEEEAEEGPPGGAQTFLRRRRGGFAA